MNISVAELRLFVENGYNINFTFQFRRFSIGFSESEEEKLDVWVVDDHFWTILKEYPDYATLAADFQLGGIPFEKIWENATDIHIDKLDLATLIKTLRFGELEFRVHHKRYFAEGTSDGYYCISFDEKDNNGESVCYHFDDDQIEKSFDMFMHARIFDGMTFSEAYNEITIIRGVFFDE